LRNGGFISREEDKFQAQMPSQFDNFAGDGGFLKGPKLFGRGDTHHLISVKNFLWSFWKRIILKQQ